MLLFGELCLLTVFVFHNAEFLLVCEMQVTLLSPSLYPTGEKERVGKEVIGVGGAMWCKEPGSPQ